MPNQSDALQMLLRHASQQNVGVILEKFPSSLERYSG